MRFAHLADLHIGKRVNEYSLLEDQQYILKEILDVLDKHRVEAVLIAGDVYDKTVPSAEAVELFDEFLVSLAGRGLPTFVISGNHDSPERMAFGGRLMTEKGVYLSPVYDGMVEPVTLTDEWGDLQVYMLPFVKPAHVRRFYPEAETATYTDALRTAVAAMNVDPAERTVLLTHQFVTGAQRTESEELSVGGTDNVDVAVFGNFDYVALGHIHRAQSCTRETVRYAGTPLKYSFSEAKDVKSVTLVDMGEKGQISVEQVELKPLRDMVELRGTYAQIMEKNFYENTGYTDAYVRITLTDEEDIPDAIGKLRTVYKKLMRLDYDNTRTRHHGELETEYAVEHESPLTRFEEFYVQQNGRGLNEQQRSYMQELIDALWEGEQ